MPFTKYGYIDQRWSMKSIGHVACMGAMGIAYSILVEKPGKKIPFGRPRSRLNYNIKMDLRCIGSEVV
jgi:hypothetical protein